MPNPLLPRWWRMYHNPTASEQAAEPAVASLGRPYRFQHPLRGGKAFPDFALVQDKVLIEVDGESHRRKGAAEADRARDEMLAEDGWRTLRVTNEEVLADAYGAIDRLMHNAGLPWRTSRPNKRS